MKQNLPINLKLIKKVSLSKKDNIPSYKITFFKKLKYRSYPLCFYYKNTSSII